jgi:hypothetical protein
MFTCVWQALAYVHAVLCPVAAGTDAVTPARRVFNSFYTKVASSGMDLDASASSHPLTITDGSRGWEPARQLPQTLPST